MYNDSLSVSVSDSLSVSVSDFSGQYIDSCVALAVPVAGTATRRQPAGDAGEDGDDGCGPARGGPAAPYHHDRFPVHGAYQCPRFSEEGEHRAKTANGPVPMAVPRKLVAFQGPEDADGSRARHSAASYPTQACRLAIRRKPVV